jgi:hypothetical protein
MLKIKIILLCSISLLTLSACETTKADKSPQSLAGDGAVAVERVEVATISPITSSPATWGDRLALLEQDVKVLKEDMNTAKPQIAKIDVIERRFRDLSLELGQIDSKYQIPAQEKSLPAKQENIVLQKDKVKPTDKPKVAPEKKPQIESGKNDKLTVKALRVGEQKNATRLVIDSNKELKLNYDLDNEEKILLIEIPSADWGTDKTRQIGKSPLIASYQVTTDQSGAKLVVQLKQPVTVKNKSYIGPSANQGHRVFLDLVAKSL